MLSTECDYRGNFQRGQMLCDNCEKVMFTYYSEANEPSSDRDSFFAAPITLRLMVKGGITSEMLKQLKLATAFAFDDYTLGYRFDIDKGHMMLDFCSEACAYQWLDMHTDYGLLFYGSLSRQIGFVRDKPERFRTEMISGFQALDYPLSNAQNFSQNKNTNYVRILNKYFTIQQHSLSPPDGGIPPSGIQMNTLIFSCPMRVGIGTGAYTCGHVLQFVAEFVPSAWICPYCNGLIMLDVQSEQQRYASADLNADLRVLEDCNLGLWFYFSSRVNLSDPQVLDWIQFRIGAMKIMTAEVYKDEEQMKKLFPGGRMGLLPMFVDLQKVERLFSYLII